MEKQDFKSIERFAEAARKDGLSLRYEKSLMAKNSLLVCLTISDLFALNVEELQALSEKPEISTLEKMLINSIVMCIMSPAKNEKLMTLLLNRFSGKVKEEIEINSMSKEKPTVIQIISEPLPSNHSGVKNE